MIVPSPAWCSGAGDSPGQGLCWVGTLTTKGERRLLWWARFYCKVDADAGPIAVGDLLTTSDTPGHAMRVADPYQGLGAVIGKALRPLLTGRTLLPILVALQYP